MFVLSVHRRQIKMAILVLCIAVVAVAFFFVSKQGVEAAKEAQMNLRAATAEERIAYLSQFGWSVEQDPVEVSEVILPETFDDTYAQYNELQKAQGFDLSVYAGKRVKRWIYRVTNYPETSRSFATAAEPNRRRFFLFVNGLPKQCPWVCSA